MHSDPRPSGVAYLMALAATGAAVLLRWVLHPWLGDSVPLVTLFAAVAFTVWIGGAGPAVLATLLGYLACDWLFLEPRGAIGAYDVRHVVTLAVYLSSCAIIIGLGHAVWSNRRRAAQEAERVGQQQFLNALLDDATVCVAVMSGPELHYTFVNKAYQALRPEMPMLDRTYGEVFPASIESGAEAVVRRVLDTGEPREDYAMAIPIPGTPDAAWDHRIVRMPSSAGAAPAVLVMTWNVTKRERAMKALAETTLSLTRERERLAIALRAGHMGVYEWRAGDEAIWWSPEIYAVFGVDPDSFTPTLSSFNAIVHPDDRAELWRKTEECMARREVFVHEYRIHTPTGEVRWVLNRSHVAVDETGKVERITGVGVDITERKRVEERLLEADRRKDEFIATLAHELRNPLAPIRNAVQLLAARGPSAPDPTWTRDIIERQVSHMARLLDDLLDISRISRNRVELQIGRVTLTSVLDIAIETSRPLIERGQHELTVTLPPQPLWLDADAVRLAQVFANLLNNAAKYTEAGGKIRVLAEQRDREVMVSIQDNGIGIAADMLPRVFEMFSQAKPALERSQGGLGIGLSLAKGLVEAMGGRIEAQSDGPGAGSQFIVHLPLADAAAQEQATLSNSATSRPHHTGRLLVADDLKDSADSLAMMLQVMGHEVRTAYNGEDAVALAETFRPDVVLLDLGMPKLNGYDACARIRSQPWGKHIYVVALTGWGHEEERRRTQSGGFDQHLVKPVDAAALNSLLASVLSARASAN